MIPDNETQWIIGHAIPEAPTTCSLFLIFFDVSEFLVFGGARQCKLIAWLIVRGSRFQTWRNWRACPVRPSGTRSVMVGLMHSGSVICRANPTYIHPDDAAAYAESVASRHASTDGAE